ncbi:MAG: hypothetical protein HUU47_09525 [Bacteroidetes bacterium]|nr:hypothetical protein [Bacteroidota bacterium]
MKNFIWLFLIISLTSKAVIFPTTQGPVSHSFGNISSLKNDPFAAYNHQGSMALATKNYISVSAKSSFFIPELNTACLAVSKKINNTQNLGLGYSFFGNKYYNESLLKLSFAKKFFNKTGGGISIDYYRLQLPKESYKVKNIFTFEIGFYTELNQNFDVAFQLINPARAPLASYNEEKLPFIANLSVVYNLNDKFTIAAEWSQTITANGFAKLGLNYKASKNLHFYAGIVNKTSSVSFGINYHFKNTLIAISFTSQPYLGYSSSAGVSYFTNHDKKPE